eukprot:7848311-Pyramimonas_sp.AAC.1
MSPPYVAMASRWGSSERRPRCRLTSKIFPLMVSTGVRPKAPATHPTVRLPRDRLPSSTSTSPTRKPTTGNN